MQHSLSDQVDLHGHSGLALVVDAQGDFQLWDIELQGFSGARRQAAGRGSAGVTTVTDGKGDV